jgi:hypothetical protein
MVTLLLATANGHCAFGPKAVTGRTRSQYPFMTLADITAMFFDGRCDDWIECRYSRVWGGWLRRKIGFAQEELKA